MCVCVRACVCVCVWEREREREREQRVCEKAVAQRAITCGYNLWTIHQRSETRDVMFNAEHTSNVSPVLYCNNVCLTYCLKPKTTSTFLHSPTISLINTKTILRVVLHFCMLHNIPDNVHFDRSLTVCMFTEYVCLKMYPRTELYGINSESRIKLVTVSLINR